MKEYISIEDIKKPQAKTVTDVEICREFALEVVKRHNAGEYDGEYAIIMTKVLNEMEEGE